MATAFKKNDRSDSTDLYVQLASNFAAFFDKLGAMLFRLGSCLPVYDELANMYKEDASGLAPHIMHSVEGVYIDVLEFFHTILRVFYNIDGSKEDRKC